MQYLPQIFVKARCIINEDALHNPNAMPLSRRRERYAARAAIVEGCSEYA
jgi:hypothetical protein